MTDIPFGFAPLPPESELEGRVFTPSELKHWIEGLAAKYRAGEPIGTAFMQLAWGSPAGAPPVFRWSYELRIAQGFEDLDPDPDAFGVSVFLRPCPQDGFVERVVQFAASTGFSLVRFEVPLSHTRILEPGPGCGQEGPPDPWDGPMPEGDWLRVLLDLAACDESAMNDPPGWVAVESTLENPSYHAAEHLRWHGRNGPVGRSISRLPSRRFRGLPVRSTLGGLCDISHASEQERRPEGASQVEVESSPSTGPGSRHTIFASVPRGIEPERRVSFLSEVDGDIACSREMESRATRFLRALLNGETEGVEFFRAGLARTVAAGAVFVALPDDSGHAVRQAVRAVVERLGSAFHDASECLQIGTRTSESSLSVAEKPVECLGRGDRSSVFVVCDPARLAGREVVLLDATLARPRSMHDAAIAIESAGARAVYCLALASERASSRLRDRTG